MTGSAVPDLREAAQPDLLEAPQMDDSFTADQLIENPALFSRGTHPVRLGVFGDPVAQSKSPLFHNAALESLGIPIRYGRVRTPANRAVETFRQLAKANFVGANVTYPLKAAALEAVDEAEDYARRAGAVNTIVVSEGRLRGFNTDGPGLSRAIRETFSVDLRDLRILLLGAGGGAGRAIAVQCAMEGCERLVLANRTIEKARELARELSPFFRTDRLAGPADRIAAVSLGPELRGHLEHCDLVVNATSLGMNRSDPAILPAAWLTPNLMVFDTVYAAGTSRLLEDAASAGARVSNGLPMLLHQGALSFEIWFNRPAPLEVMRAALL